MKRPQNIIAESGLTLPTAVVYGLGIWLLKGLIPHRLWLQMAAFFLTVYMMVEMSNSNALLRVRSRMVSSTFVILSCAASFLFPSLPGNLMQVGVVGALLLLFHTYQDSYATGKIYFAFLFWGLSTLAFPQLFFFVPLIWLLMATQLRSLNLRTVLASILGLATPYWFVFSWSLFKGDLSWLIAHFHSLSKIAWTSGYASLTVGQLSVLVFTFLLTLVSIVHLWKYAFEDKTRIRLIYGFFTTLALVSTAYIFIVPQAFNQIFRLVLISASPIIAHFFTLTSHRFTNIFFFVTLALAVAITALNLWMPSLNF